MFFMSINIFINDYVFRINISRQDLSRLFYSRVLSLKSFLQVNVFEGKVQSWKGPKEGRHRNKLGPETLSSVMEVSWDSKHSFYYRIQNKVLKEQLAASVC